MKFGPIAVEDAAGKILGHNITGPDGRRAFRKGKPLSPEDVRKIRELGHETIYVAELGPDDVDENSAAGRIAQKLMQENLRLSGPSTGRANFYAMEAGIVRVDVERLQKINSCQGVTLATLTTNTAVSKGKVVATLKILPYAIPEETVAGAEAIAGDDGPLIQLDALAPQRVSLILSGSPPAKERVVRTFENALSQRLQALGSEITTVDFVTLDEEADEAALADMIAERVKDGADLLILAGETAIMDRHDITPRAVERAGGEVACYGAPVDPGNLLMLAYVDDVPIMGAPGCARSPKDNIVDLVLPRLLAGDRLTKADVVAFAHGGLLEDVPERPSPRSRLA